MTRPLVLAACLAVPLAVLLAALLAALPARAQGKLEPGEWEQKITMTGFHGNQAMEQVVRQCITSGDVAIFADKDRWAQEMVAANPEAKCRVVSSKQDGTGLSVTLDCVPDTRLQVRHDYRGTTGTIDAETISSGKTVGRNHIESRKVSDKCSPETIEQWKVHNPGKTFAP